MYTGLGEVEGERNLGRTEIVDGEQNLVRQEALIAPDRPTDTSVGKSIYGNSISRGER
jgi:hypothetical protein